MTSLPLRIGLGALAAVILVVSVMFVLQLGPFNHRPSAAAKEIPKVQAAVATTQTQATAAVGAAETKTVAATAAVQKKVEDHVAKIRAAPDGAADDEFYRSVCDTKLYQGSADCRGFGGQPEGDHPAHRKGAVRGG